MFGVGRSIPFVLGRCLRKSLLSTNYRSFRASVPCYENGNTIKYGGKSLAEMEDVYKNVMKNVPQTVVVVTTAEYDVLKDVWKKRGMTCTSFTNVSFDPPIISVCIKKPSRMHDILMKTQAFAVHVLANDQIKYGLYFSQPPNEDYCQFGSVPHVQGEEGIPVISGCSAVLQCKAQSVHTVGDHHVWYGNVMDAIQTQDKEQPLLYFTRSFRSVGDEIFLQAFEDATLPFEDWTHEAHLRMSWNYITEYGRERAVPLIRDGIQRFNKQNAQKVKFGYHETITMIYIYVVSAAVEKTGIDVSFDDFLAKNNHLLDRNLPSHYYTKEILFSDEARYRFVSPDIKNLPS